jgi:hypothetical protein
VHIELICINTLFLSFQSLCGFFKIIIEFEMNYYLILIQHDFKNNDKNLANLIFFFFFHLFGQNVSYVCCDFLAPKLQKNSGVKVLKKQKKHDLKKG